MGTDAHIASRRRIGTTVRRLRADRLWSQVDLARRLGLAQSQLSRVEQGEASLTAEQFLVVLELFNVSSGEFVVSSEDLHSLQNALVRFGAAHLRQVADAPVRTAHDSPRDAVRAVLLDPSSERFVTALAPVLVRSADAVPLPALQHDLQRAGVPNRLPWLVENTLEALRRQVLSQGPSGRRDTARADFLLDAFLALQAPPPAGDSEPIDPFDPGVRSKKTQETLWKEVSPISRKWRIASSIQLEDFSEALRGALGPG